MRTQFSERAKQDIFDIGDYLNAVDLIASQKTTQQIEYRIAQLLSFPEIGTSSTQSRRRLVVTNTEYIIFYRIQKQTIQILRVLHGKRKMAQ